MTRRIALTMLALITALLVLAVVPLGISMTDRERTRSGTRRRGTPGRSPEQARTRATRLTVE